MLDTCAPAPTRTARPPRIVAHAVWVLVVALGVTAPVQGEAGRVTFAGGRAAFSPPRGFTPLTAEEIKQFLPHLDSQSSAVGDNTRSMTVVYRSVDVKLTRSQMDPFRRYLTQTFEQAGAELRWVVNRVDTVGGRDGIRLEFEDSKQVRHITLVGHVDDEHAIMMSYNIPIKDLARSEPAIRASIASLAIKP
jgi:hypothetical protein